jgi:hypothetical protein
MSAVKKMVVCLVAVIGTSGLARAAEADASKGGARGAPVIVYEVPVDEFQTLNAKFDADSDLGRAWVDVEKFDTEFFPSRNTVNKKVDGLSYDEATKDVVYQLAGKAIVCAQASNFLGMTTLRPTGNCPLVVSYEERTVDDGVRPSTQKFAKVTMTPNPVSTQMSER